MIRAWVISDWESGVTSPRVVIHVGGRKVGRIESYDLSRVWLMTWGLTCPAKGKLCDKTSHTNLKANDNSDEFYQLL